MGTERQQRFTSHHQRHEKIGWKAKDENLLIRKKTCLKSLQCENNTKKCLELFKIILQIVFYDIKNEFPPSEYSARLVVDVHRFYAVLFFNHHSGESWNKKSYWKFFKCLENVLIKLDEMIEVELDGKLMMLTLMMMIMNDEKVSEIFSSRRNI